MKRILLVHPNNILMGNQGENNRVIGVIRLLKSIGYSVDLMSFQNFSPDSNFDDFENMNKEGLITNLFLYDFQTKNNISFGFVSKLNRKMKSLLRKIQQKIFGKKKPLQNWIQAESQILFDQILKDNEYDSIGLFYTYLATLFMDTTTKIKAKKIYFVEDSMFLQQYSWEDASNPSRATLGSLMDEELKRMESFDEFFCISYDEKLFYEKLTGREMHFLPHIFLTELPVVTTPFLERKWDVFFIGFNNPYNVEGLEWFINKVYPLLNPDLNILLGGSATTALDKKTLPKNITAVSYVADLDKVFSQSKVSICPMFRGTGMKIKVVESIARGIPVVCNERGVDGFPDKTLSGSLKTQDPKEFADYINRLSSDENFHAKTSQACFEYYQKIFDVTQYAAVLEKTL